MENSNQASAIGGKWLDERTKTLLVAAMSGIGNAIFALVIALMVADANGLINL